VFSGGSVSVVTAVRPDVRRTAVAALLDDGARSDFEQLLDRDPIVNAMVAARLTAAGSLDPERLGGHVVGVRAADGLAGGCFAGSNLVLVGGDSTTWSAVADFVAERPRYCTSIVGRAEAVAAMWPRIEPRWGAARAMRAEQPLLVLAEPVAVVGEPGVRPVSGRQLDRYLAAAAAMFTEELGVSPHVSPGTAAFHARIRGLIAERRAFASVDFRGQVVFKAEIGAVSRHTAQVQGVWVRPDLRGRGLGTRGLATVLAHALTLAPTASLYVNDFNLAARRVYARLGMRQHATLATVLLT
jgi:predicted GNAT family acetyltransferase